MEEESSDALNFDVVPANNSCLAPQNKPVIVPAASSGNNAASNMLAQQAADSKGDANLTVNPIPNTQKGGNLKKYIISFMGKEYTLSGKNEIDSMKNVINERIFKGDRIIEVYENGKNNKKMNNSSYILRGNKKNVFKKI